MRSPAVSVLVCLGDGAERNAAFLEALARHSPEEVPFETLLFDDATTDATREVLAAVSGDVRVVREEAPVGRLAALNRLARLARAPVLVLADPSVLPWQGWLEPLLARLGEDPGLAAVVPRLVRRDGRLSASFGTFAEDGRPLLSGEGHPSPEDPSFSVFAPCAFVRSALVAVRAGAWAEAGGFDEAFPPGVPADADLSLRLRATGLRLGYEPAALGVALDAPEEARGTLRFLALHPAAGEEAPRPLRRVRTVAFYLPQFHPCPENDRFWGKGFTDWANVAAAAPLFPGHDQPHLPGELGFYDLRLPEVREAQAELARDHGVEAFCFYHYWFEGHRPLSGPLDAMLRSGRPDFPFLLCWANEDWRSNWDGGSGEVLLCQGYSADDDRRHAAFLASVFEDPRYLRVEGRPLFLVYAASGHPDPPRFVAALREAARRRGLPEPFCCRVESGPEEHGDPRALGFDASVGFQPDWRRLDALAKGPGLPRVVEYAAVLRDALAEKEPPFRRIPCVVPRWDNTPRRKAQATVLDRASPEAYRAALGTVAAREALSAEGPLVFVNAFNEWGEGAHLEPDRRHGRGFLEAHRDALGRPARKARPGAALAVCGMHRSGTSLVASWLSACGLRLHDGRVIGPSVGNERGHFEDAEIVELDARAITRTHPESHGWKVADARPCRMDGAAFAEARELVRRRSRRLGPWGFKDPRATLLLEDWAEAAAGLAVLLLWRPCAEVVDSLLRRSAAATDPVLKVDPDTACRAWIAYNEAALGFRRLYPEATLLFPVRSVLAQPEKVLSLLEERFGLGLRPVPLAGIVGEGLGTARAELGAHRERAEALEAELAGISDL